MSQRVKMGERRRRQQERALSARMAEAMVFGRLARALGVRQIVPIIRARQAP